MRICVSTGQFSISSWPMACFWTIWGYQKAHGRYIENMQTVHRKPQIALPKNQLSVKLSAGKTRSWMNRFSNTSRETMVMWFWVCVMTCDCPDRIKNQHDASNVKYKSNLFSSECTNLHEKCSISGVISRRCYMKEKSRTSQRRNRSQWKRKERSVQGP